MKILITGVAGFIGSHLAETLLKMNYEIIGLDNLNDYYDIKNWYESAATVAAMKVAGLTMTNIEKGERTATIDVTNITGTSISAITNVVLGLSGLTGDAISVTFNAASTAADTAADLAAAIGTTAGVVSAYYTVKADGNKVVFTSKAQGKNRYDFSGITFSGKQLSGAVEGVTSINFVDASVAIETLIEAVDGAFVQFTSDNSGVAGTRVLTLVGTAGVSSPSATLLNVSGLSTTDNLYGDDEAITAGTDLTAKTSDNQAAVTAASKNNVQYITAS